MPTTYEAIATVTVGSGGAANIEFTSIPGTYTDLVIQLSARSVRSSYIDYLRLDVNNNTSTIYSTRRLSAYGSTASSGSDSSQTFLWTGIVPGATATSSTFGSTQIYVPNYAGNSNKSFSIESVLENNSGTDWEMAVIAGLASTTSAITSIKLYNQISNFAQYSTATLYGIKKE